jgi:hypothetical protein
MAFLSVEVIREENPKVLPYSLWHSLCTSENMNGSLEWWAGPNESCIVVYVITCELATEGRACRRLGLLYVLILPFMFVAYSNWFDMRVVCDQLLPARNKKCVFRWVCPEMQRRRSIDGPPVSVATQCLRIQGWTVSYMLIMFLWYVNTCLPNHTVSRCRTPQCARSLPWDVASQIDVFIEQRPGGIVRPLRWDRSNNNGQVYSAGMRLLKKHRPCFVTCFGRMALWTKWSWVLPNSKFSPTS